jgi:hypothetical protein
LQAEDGLDSLSDRGEVGSWCRFVSAGGAEDRPANDGNARAELAAGLALVRDDHLAACQRAGKKGERDHALGPVAETSAAARGVPSGAQARCKRQPENQREWSRE